ncbi:MAG: hypothetical protein ACI8QC_003391 [Planctomycetota bacterium]|jgi:hypothetical protein
MKHILACLALVLCAPFAGAQKFDHDHAALTELLEAHVKGDRVDYKALDKQRSKLGAYLQSLSAVQPKAFEAWTREQRFAFWINAYNAYTLELILDELPLKSIKDIGGWFSAGPWEKRFIPLQKLAGLGSSKDLNLETIEHKILRPRFKDARMHAAINCASIGCPPIRAEAYVATKLDKQLAEQVSVWLGDALRNQYDAAAKKVKISKIFDWFEKDFGKNDAAVLAWIAKHGPAATVAWMKDGRGIKLSYLKYDWKLNDVKR